MTLCNTPVMLKIEAVNTLQHTATTLQHTIMTLCNTLVMPKTEIAGAFLIHCNILLLRCNTLHHTAPHCKTLQRVAFRTPKRRVWYYTPSFWVWGKEWGDPLRVVTGNKNIQTDLHPHRRRHGSHTHSFFPHCMLLSLSLPEVVYTSTFLWLSRWRGEAKVMPWGRS